LSARALDELAHLDKPAHRHGVALPLEVSDPLDEPARGRPGRRPQLLLRDLHRPPRPLVRGAPPVGQLGRGALPALVLSLSPRLLFLPLLVLVLLVVVVVTSSVASDGWSPPPPLCTGSGGRGTATTSCSAAAASGVAARAQQQRPHRALQPTARILVTVAQPGDRAEGHA
jgi:hypothetical protein